MIPKKIHQVWIGPKKMPVEWMRTWKDKNPSFEYILWDTKKIDGLLLQMQGKYDYFVNREEYHGAADIVRVEILERYGGVYVDADSACMEPIENTFFMNTDFFAVRDYRNNITNGVIGSVPGHPILKDYIQKIKAVDNRKTKPIWYTIGGQLFTSCIKKYINQHKDGKDKQWAILPVCSFYPTNYDGQKARVISKIYAEQFWGTTNNLYE